MVRALIYFKGAKSSELELEFAYPLKEGDSFVIDYAEERCICKVEAFLHYPVGAGSNEPPRVGYIVARYPVNQSYWKREFWANLLASIGKPK